MARQTSSMVETTVARPGMLRALRIVVPLATLLVLIQAIFAGRGLFFAGKAIEIHGGIGNLTLLLVLIQVVLVFLAGIPGRQRTHLIGINVLLLLLVVTQLGLGYTGRDNTTAAALHVPNGVLIFGLMAANLSSVFRLRA